MINYQIKTYRNRNLEKVKFNNDYRSQDILLEEAGLQLGPASPRREEDTQ